MGSSLVERDGGWFECVRRAWNHHVTVPDARGAFSTVIERYALRRPIIPARPRTENLLRRYLPVASEHAADFIRAEILQQELGVFLYEAYQPLSGGTLQDLVVLDGVAPYWPYLRATTSAVNVRSATTYCLQAGLNVFSRLEECGLWERTFSLEEHILRVLLGVDDE